MDSATHIEPFEKGNKERTALHASVMNELVDALNRILSIRVVPATAGEFFWSDANGVLLLNPVDSGCGTPPATGTYVCGSIEGVQQWMNTEECACGVDGGSA